MNEQLKARVDEVIVEHSLDLYEYKRELLCKNTSYSRLLFICGVTRKQNHAIKDLMREYHNKVESGEYVDHISFEKRIYEIVPQHSGDSHFAELVAKGNYRRGRWKKVFETLYGGMPKF